MTSSHLHVFLLVFVYSLTLVSPQDRAQVTLRIECSKWRNVSKDSMKVIRQMVATQIRVCFSSKQESAINCSLANDLQRNLFKCGNNTNSTQIARFGKKIAMTQADLYFNIYASSNNRALYDRSLQVLSSKWIPKPGWFLLNSTRTLKSFLRISARLTCVAPFSGPLCLQVNPCYNHSCPAKRQCLVRNASAVCACPNGEFADRCGDIVFFTEEPNPDKLALSLNTLLGSSAAGLSLAILVGITCWFVLKKRKMTRSNDREDVYDIYDYEAPYYDGEDAKNLESVKSQENHYTLQISTEEPPALPPR